MEYLAPEAPPKPKLDVQFGDWVYRHQNADLLKEVRERTRTFSGLFNDYTRTLMVEPATTTCCDIDLRLYGDRTVTDLGTPAPMVFARSRLTSPPCGHWIYWRPPIE
ncbi:hypothetical protein CH296_18925 [Rhodococcus sp. 14-2496-1d]|nr:hypothetical protein CH296_18925 [Rhodococcus sp. 14-2496-1d]